nr:uroporphyrinogen-III synthase [Pacificimonas pallii]
MTRPERQSRRTAARLAGLGHSALASPLLKIVPARWPVPDERPGAIFLTSANAVAGGVPDILLDVPVYAMGRASADAARRAGLLHVESLQAAGAADLYEKAAARGVRSALHLCGRDLTDAAVPPGMTIRHVMTYAAEACPLSADAIDALRGGKVDLTLLYSSRTAARFASEVDRLAIRRGAQAVVLIGPALETVIGSGWKDVRIAAMPNEDALLAAAGLLCERQGVR